MNFHIVHIILILLLFAGTLSAQRRPSKTSQQFDLNDYQQRAEEMLTNLENHGYPFATIAIQTSDPINGDMTPKIVIDSNIFVTFDSIVLKGDVKLSQSFLYPYLGLKRGMPYNESLMKAVFAKLEELPFATIAREPGVAFVQDKAYLYIYLNQRKTNQFDGYIGMIPADEKTGRVAFNGELSLALQNIFKIGETIALQWNSSERYSQHLNVAVKFPYLFRTKFGVNGTFQLDKQDTSFLTLQFRIGIPYAFINNCYIEPYYNFSSSNILNNDLLDIGNDNSYIDYRKSLYGLKAHFRRLDYLFNPRKGIDLMADLSAGRRKILPNNHWEASDYEDNELTHTTYQLLGSVRGYIPLGKHFVLTPSMQAGSFINPTHYNECFKIGGNGYLRGFNPNDIRATTYLLYSVEARYLFGKKSFANLFFDGGVYEQHTERNYLFDTPFGFGAGVHLAVKSGIFYLEYALGRQLGNPISLKTGKIHFGINVEF